MKLTGLCAIISGASQGLGFEVAKQFVQEGADVMICARNPESLYKAQQELLLTALKSLNRHIINTRFFAGLMNLRWLDGIREGHLNLCSTHKIDRPVKAFHHGKADDRYS